jgi:hypothetical protein
MSPRRRDNSLLEGHNARHVKPGVGCNSIAFGTTPVFDGQDGAADALRVRLPGGFEHALAARVREHPLEAGDRGV